MALFKDVKKPVIRQSPRATADVSPLRPKFVARRPPCSAGCGAGVDVRAWVTALARADAGGPTPQQAAEEAWRILADANPFPATLGRICPHRCEQACHRRNKEGAVAINALERWLGDVALARGFALARCARTGRQGRIAVVGAGPAGLSCAYQLVRRGHAVAVFEARELPGGRLRDAIRTGRLDARTVDEEIARILRLGVALRCAATVADDLDDLAAAHDFVFVATGRASRRGGPAGQANGQLPTADAESRGLPRSLLGGDAVEPGLVASAIASGRLAAEAIDATINGRPPELPVADPTIGEDRLKLAWYPDAPRHEWPAGESRAADAEIAAEAGRCLSCGLCMDCERCWMYCTNNCFEKLPPGQHYRVSVETCNGCRKCADECPCGYIDMV